MLPSPAAFELARRTFARHTHQRRRVTADLHWLRDVQASARRALEAVGGGAVREATVAAQAAELLAIERARTRSSAAIGVAARAALPRVDAFRVHVLRPQAQLTRRPLTLRATLDATLDARDALRSGRAKVDDVDALIDALTTRVDELERQLEAVVRLRVDVDFGDFVDAMTSEVAAAIEAVGAAEVGLARDLALDRVFDAHRQLVEAGVETIEASVRGAVLSVTRRFGPQGIERAERAAGARGDRVS